MNLPQRFEILSAYNKERALVAMLDKADEYDLDNLFQSLYNIALANSDTAVQEGIQVSDLDEAIDFIV